MTLKFAIVVGTRPEIVKMAPIIRACQKKKINFFILHSGQHYDKNMDSIFFEELELPKPDYNLHVGSQSFRKHVGLMMKGMNKIFKKEQPDVVIVQGDTLTVLMAALAAKKWDIPVAHHEAGLRSHDLSMPEEINRILTDHISEYLFCPTNDALENIKFEGLNAQYYLKTGNTIVDAVKENIELANKKVDVLKKFNLVSKKYFLITAHRAENTDVKERLEGILKGIEKLTIKYPKYKFVFSLHPRTKKKIEEYNLTIPSVVKVVDPLGFLEFLQLEKNAAIVLTDSGGLQEECSILRVPVVTLRENTERPETITAKMNVLAGTNPDKIVQQTELMLNAKIEWKDVFGDGHSGEIIIEEIVKLIKKRKSLKERLKWIKRMIIKNINYYSPIK
ncbi:UDP-N-acetylglucosamine 2-epimerase (non-hydrolyzing) [Candidatus Woesearchaeota archaeon CG10_big_fil_rev_8_21_14_0_10_32_9]|nr:MAG: UDP-N-acetylglucosamine 2-epimerase (non-hydrolyzing) [Candidatus Woesearchaeota archaeon CG10_big_fil_rev_8_21_14_0_10_32_9]